MADKNIRLAWTVTTSYTTVVTPEELRLVLLDALPSPVPDRAMWEQDITNASPQELADLASDLTLSRTAPAFENWLAARASNNHAPDGPTNSMRARPRKSTMTPISRRLSELEAGCDSRRWYQARNRFAPRVKVDQERNESPMPYEESQTADSGNLWEDIRAMTARVGDITPAGSIEAIDYFGTIGVVLLINGQDYHRGIDAVISRKVRS